MITTPRRRARAALCYAAVLVAIGSWSTGVAGAATGFNLSPTSGPPGTVVNGSGDPYKVFTPFSRAWRAHGWDDPQHAPRNVSWVAADDDKRVAAMLDKALDDARLVTDQTQRKAIYEKLAKLVLDEDPLLYIYHRKILIAHTTKGKGVAYMEGKVEWHYRSPSPELLAEALAGLTAVNGESRDA